MGLFGGLVKDSPLTFWVNAGRSAKGRVGKARAKARTRARETRPTTAEVDPYEYEPNSHAARRFGTYFVIAAFLMPFGGYFVAAFVLLAIGGALIAYSKTL